MVTHWTRPIVSHDIGYQVIMISPNYRIVWAINLKRILS